MINRAPFLLTGKEQFGNSGAAARSQSWELQIDILRPQHGIEP